MIESPLNKGGVFRALPFTFRRDSGWWINIYAQRMAELRWNDAIPRIQEFRDPILYDLYAQTAEIQKAAARAFYENQAQYEKHRKVPTQVVKLITDFAFDAASQWHGGWKFLGDQLLTDYWAIQATSASRLPAWWLDLINYEFPAP